MKREVVLLVFGVFLMMFMIRGTLAECQYKNYTEGSKPISNLYINGTKQINVLETRNTFCNYNTLTMVQLCSFEVFNNKDFSVNVRVEFSQGTFTSFENIIIPAHQFIGISRSSIGKDTVVILFDTIEFKFQTNNYTEARWEKEIIENCKQCSGKDCLNNGQNCTYDFECGSNVCSQTGNTKGFCISQRSDFEIRISSLEANMTLLQSWKQTISETITSILNTLTGHTTKIDNQNTRILNLENQTGTPPQNPFPEYLMRLSLSNRKTIVCEYGEYNHLYAVQGLGWNCAFIYKKSSSGRETVTCKCVKG